MGAFTKTRFRPEGALLNRLNTYAFAVALSLWGVEAASAADAVTVPPEAPSGVESQRWALQITPYVWAAGLKGDISPFQRAPTIGIEKSFSDVLSDLNFSGFVNVWGRYDRFVISGDMMYVDTTESHAYGNLPPLPITIPPGTVVKGDVDSKQFMATLQAGYRVVDTPKFTLDALGGIRFWHISNDVTVSALSLSRSYGESFNWVDPVVGTRAHLRLTDKLSMQAQADIGGFGAGSELTWSVLGTVNYLLTDHLSVSAGYKALHVDYDRNDYVFDSRLNGPILGATWRF